MLYQDEGGHVSTDGVLAAGSTAQALLDALPDATAILEHGGTITAVNRAWRMFALDNGGEPTRTCIGANYLEVCTRSVANGCPEATAIATGLHAVLDGHAVHREFEYPCPTPTAELWFLLRITPLNTPFQGAVVSHINITRRRGAEQELVHQAAHDPLTGLANRTLFRSTLTDVLRPGVESGSDNDHVGVLYIDLDGLKHINDTYGHDAGDLVLQATAHRLRNQLRSRDTVARLGGDEFAVIAARLSRADLSRLATEVENALARPHHVHGHAVYAPASVGAHLAIPGADIDEVVRAADRAMYTIKQSRRTDSSRRSRNLSGR